MGLFDKPESNNDKERECGCCIKIEDCIVVIICGEVDVDSLKDSLQTALEAKGNAKLAVQV